MSHYHIFYKEITKQYTENEDIIIRHLQSETVLHLLHLKSHKETILIQ